MVGGQIKMEFKLEQNIYNAFKIENLFLQAEYNAVRPYTYSHDELNYNFGHNNQPLAHLWGSNFNEFIVIARYSKDRWFANSKISILVKKDSILIQQQILLVMVEIFTEIMMIELQIMEIK